jgi:hypothetical protein
MLDEPQTGVCRSDWSGIVVRSRPLRRGDIPISRPDAATANHAHRASLTATASAATTIQTNLYRGGGGGCGVLDIL